MTAPAFIHIDVDDLWAIGECYGLTIPAEHRHAVSESALPEFRRLFRRMGIRATFFVVGRDLESPGYAAFIQGLLEDGHEIANHSFSHRLDFRNLNRETIREEIMQCHQAVAETFGVKMMGFRAPGYAWSNRLLEVLGELNYRYDASLMPGPYGPVFRWLDKRIQQRSAGITVDEKTQYPLLADTFNSLRPSHTPFGNPPLIQLTSATAPGTRLPWQAGVCMRLGWPYFRAAFEGFRRLPGIPFIFLFHAADLADFNAIPIPFFRDSALFGSPIEERVSLAERFIARICQSRQVITTEEWLG